MNLVLRIKKQFFESILNGTKTIEYRNNTPFYQKRVFRGDYNSIILHYQSPRRLKADIVRIELISNPFFETRAFLPQYISTPYLIAIYMTNVRLVSQ